MNPTNVEKKSLASHVEMCALRYGELESRLSNIELKVEKLANLIDENKNGLSKVIIGATGTMITGIISIIIVLLTKF